MSTRPVFYRPYTKQFDGIGGDTVGPGLYDIKRDPVRSKSSSFPHERERPLIQPSQASPIAVRTFRTKLAPALYKTGKWLPIKAETPGPAYFPPKQKAGCKIYTTDRFVEKPNYEKMAERIVAETKQHSPPIRGWIAKGQAFSGDRYKDDISWMRYIDINM